MYTESNGRKALKSESVDVLCVYGALCQAFGSSLSPFGLNSSYVRDVISSASKSVRNFSKHGSLFKMAVLTAYEPACGPERIRRGATLQNGEACQSVEL